MSFNARQRLPARLFELFMVSIRSTAWLVLLACSFGYAYPRPPEGNEPIPKLMSDSSLVCKGEVSFAPPIKFAPQPPRFSGTANVHVDRCFKGDLPSSDISVLFDDVLPAAGGPSVVLRTGDYRLFFLKFQEGKYKPTEEFFSVLTISRFTSAPPASITDPMRLLELDLEAGLDDSDPDSVLDSIRMLGNMGHLQSTAELKKLERSPDPLVRAYVYEAMLRLGNYSVLPAVGKFFASQPEAPRELFMPRDRLQSMQYRLASQIRRIKDASVLPQLEKFLFSNKLIIRQNALQAVRTINSSHSAPFFYELLNDYDVDIRFGAMQGLLSLAGGGDIRWVPTWEEFDRQPDLYTAKCREWWDTEGKKKLAH
ncbi:MAG TPA: HEAT repeat domain-containing protein [Candidatus Angelobacter sp.]